MNIDIKNIDITKLDLGLRHEYIPDTELNKGLDDKEKVVFDCEYFGVGEKTRFAAASEDGTITMDFPKVFLRKVKGIRNLTINGKAVTTSEAFMKYPDIPALNDLMMSVVLHIVRSDDLSGDETKN